MSVADSSDKRLEFQALGQHRGLALFAARVVACPNPAEAGVMCASLTLPGAAR